MNKWRMKKLNSVLLFVCSILFVASILSLILFSNPTAPQKVYAEATLKLEVQELYNIDAEVNFPASVKVAEGETEYDSIEGTLVYPDKIAYNTGRDFILNQLGEYALRYYYKNAEAKVVYVEKVFNVVKNKGTVTSSSSQIEYKALTHTYAEESETGLGIKLTDTDTFVYNNVINLKESGLTDIMTFTHIMPEDAGNTATKLRLKLTDCYNEKIFIEYEITIYEHNRNSSMKASFCGGTFYGLNASSTETSVCIDGVYYTTRYTQGPYSNFDGKYFTIFYDAETMRSYFQLMDGSSQPKMVGDFSCFDLYGSKTFAGFTTNEVILSMSASLFNAERYELEFYKIGEDVGEDLQAGAYKETTPPRIEVDYQSTYRNAIYAAFNSKIELFKAKAIDVNAATLTTEVYYNYGKENQLFVPIFDNAFTTRYFGEYTIVYKAVDVFGNESVVEIPVYCVTTPNNQMISIEIDDDISMMSVTVGEEVQLPQKDKVHVSSINLAATYTVKAVYEKENYEVLLGDDMKFVPLYAGEWKIVYIMTDNVTTVEEAFTLDIAAYDGIVGDGTPTMPKRFIKDAQYVLEEYWGYAFSGERREKVALEVSARFDGVGEYAQVENGIVKIVGSNSVSFQYTYNGDIIKTTQEYPIVDVGFNGDVKMSNYFLGNFSAVEDTNKIDFSSLTTSGENTLEFIKEISFTNFQFEFKQMEGKTNYDEVKIRLTDYYDENTFIDIRILLDGAKSRLIVGDVAESFTMPTTNMLVVYDAASATIMLDKTKVAVENIFQTDKVYFSVTLVGMEGESGISIVTLNNQGIAQIMRGDRVTPQLAVKTDLLIRRLGDEITLYMPDATDVLSPILPNDIKIQVFGPDGNFASNTEGVELDGVVLSKEMHIVLNLYGDYIITYSVTDQSKRTVEFHVSYKVLDLDPPEISFDKIEQGAIINVKLGETHTFESVTYKDAAGGTEVSKLVYVYTPLNALCLQKTESFTPTEKGIYKVIVKVEDESFNSASVYYYLNVQ